MEPSLPSSVDFVVAAYSQDFLGKAMSVAGKLRKVAGKTVDMYPDSAKKVKNVFNYADRVGASRIAFVAPAEWEKGLVRIKSLRLARDVAEEEKQLDVPIDDLANVDSYFAEMEGLTVPAPTAGGVSHARATAAAPGGGGTKAATDGDLEALLVDQPYLGGFLPSRRDREYFESLLTGRPGTPALGRWYDHIASFTPVEREAWL